MNAQVAPYVGSWYCTFLLVMKLILLYINLLRAYVFQSLEYNIEI